MATQDINTLFQELSEVVPHLRALSETIELRHGQVDKLHDLLRSDVADLRKDQSELEEKLDCVICVMQHDLEGLRTDAAESARSISQLVDAVRELRQPVAEMVALRARAGGLILGFGVLGSALLWLAEPVYRWTVEHSFLKQ